MGHLNPVWLVNSLVGKFVTVGRFSDIALSILCGIVTIKCF